MPTLAQTLKQRQRRVLTRDSSGSLVEQSPQELQTLASQAGLQSPPITPAGAGALGANPDQQKMAGTPQQKAAAIQMSSEPGQSLQDTLRRGQGNERSQMTGEEQAGAEKSQALKDLGGLGDRVNNFINSQRTKLQTASQPVQVGVADTATSGQDLSGQKDLLAQLRANPNDMNLQLQLNQALGRNANSPVSPDEINQMYESAVDSISRAGGEAVDDKLSVNDLINQGSFGYDAQSLSNLLGVPADQLAGMSVGQLRNEISRVTQQEFSNAEALQKKAQSTELGSAERAVAQQAGREASRTGLRASEADMQNLDQQIANADQVQFGGQTYKVDDLLRDDTMSGIISNYMNAAPGSPQREQLEKSEPGLVEFIRKNEALLEDASKALSAGAQGFQEIQDYNKQVAQQLPENLRNILVPEGSSLSASKVDVASRPLLQAIQTDPSIANRIAGVDDNDARDLATLDANQVAQLFSNGGQGWDQYQQQKKTVEDQRQDLIRAADDEELMQKLFNGKYTGSITKLDTDYAAQRRAAMLGLPNSAGDFSALDPNGDGHVESPGALRDMALQKLGSFSLRDAVSGGRPGNAILPAPGDATNAWNGNQQEVYSRLSPFMDDGRIDQAELLKSGLSQKQLLNLGLELPALQGNWGDLMSAVSQKGIDDIESQYNLGKPAEARQALEELLKERDSLQKYWAKSGTGGGHVRDDFQSEIDSLSRRVGDYDAADRAAEDEKTRPARERLEKANSLISKLNTGPAGKTSGRDQKGFSLLPNGTVRTPNGVVDMDTFMRRYGT